MVAIVVVGPLSAPTVGVLPAPAAPEAKAWPISRVVVRRNASGLPEAPVCEPYVSDVDELSACGFVRIIVHHDVLVEQLFRPRKIEDLLSGDGRHHWRSLDT